MKMEKKPRLIIILVIILVAAFAVISYIKGPQNNPISSTAPANNQPEQATEKQIISPAVQAMVGLIRGKVVHANTETITVQNSDNVQDMFPVSKDASVSLTPNAKPASLSAALKSISPEKEYYFRLLWQNNRFEVTYIEPASSSAR